MDPTTTRGGELADSESLPNPRLERIENRLLRFGLGGRLLGTSVLYGKLSSTVPGSAEAESAG